MAEPDRLAERAGAELERLCTHVLLFIFVFVLDTARAVLPRALTLMGKAFSKVARSRLLFPDTEGWPLDAGSDDEDDYNHRRPRPVASNGMPVGIPVAGGVDEINSVDALGLAAIVCVVALAIAATGSVAAAIVAVPTSVAVIIGCYTVAIRHTASAHARMYAAKTSAHADAVTRRHAQLITTFGSLLERVGHDHADRERCAVCSTISSMLRDAQRNGRPRPAELPEPIQLPPSMLASDAQDRDNGWTRYAAQAVSGPNEQYHDAIAHAARQAAGDRMMRDAAEHTWPEARGHIFQPADTEHQRRSHAASRASSRAASGPPSQRQRPQRSPSRARHPEAVPEEQAGVLN